MTNIKSSSSLILALAILTTLIPQEARAAKILAVAFISSRSHKITYEPLLHALAGRGHHVTTVTPYSTGKQIPNLREITTIDYDAALSRMPNVFELREKGGFLGFLNPLTIIEFFTDFCSQTYDLPQVQELLKESFDLIIASAVFAECHAGYMHKFNTSLILVTPLVAPGFIAARHGNPNPPSFVPNLFTGFDDQMTFSERTINFIADILIRIGFDWIIQPAMAKVYREKLNDPNIPDNVEILKNASLILSNSHFSLSKPRPFLPDIVEVGGMHCRPAKPLPKDLEDFVSSSGPEGFIFFSMGSLLKGTQMSETSRQIFLSTFGKLKQKVLWKWETEEMVGLPSNVKLSKWLPQQDVLGHPKIKAFITHGGFGGITEAVYHAVPLVGIPMAGDQYLNMVKAEAAGYALTLDFSELSEEKLSNAIQRVLTEPRFKENVDHLSSTFRDQPDQPLDRAVYWTEYVLRHQGATHLRSAARELNAIQYHSIDVVIVLASALATCLYVIFRILRALLCLGRPKVAPKTEKIKRN